MDKTGRFINMFSEVSQTEKSKWYIFNLYVESKI